MAHRKWKEIKQQPSTLPGPAVPGCSLVHFHFLWAILCPQAVDRSGLFMFFVMCTEWGMLHRKRTNGLNGLQCSPYGPHCFISSATSCVHTRYRVTASASITERKLLSVWGCFRYHWPQTNGYSISGAKAFAVTWYVY